jgi:hypothetical protein
MTQKISYKIKTQMTLIFDNFGAITKLTASGWKAPLLPHPLLSVVGGAGGKGCFLHSPEDLLHKNMNCTHIIIKSS